MTSYPSYKYPHAKADYAEIADALKLGGKTLDEKVIGFLDRVLMLVFFYGCMVRGHARPWMRR